MNISTIYARPSHDTDIDMMTGPFREWVTETYRAVVQSPSIRYRFREVFRSTGRREWHREDLFIAKHGEQVCPSVSGISMEATIDGITVRYEEFPDRAEMRMGNRFSIIGKFDNGYTLEQSKVLFGLLLRMSMDPFSDL